MFSITPIRASFVERARGAGLDDLDQQVEQHIAEGGEPCRDALRRARPGERLILASYCPFERAGPYREYGPVFILAQGESTPAAREVLPIDGETPYLRTPFVLRAYSSDERIVDAVVTETGQAQAELARLLANDRTAFVLARFAAYGCYACRIDRRS
jgi:hypothetical protein